MTLALGVVVLSAPAAPAFHLQFGDTYRLSLGQFTLIGQYSQRSCAVQAGFRSVTGQPAGFAIYWRPGRALYLITTHPGTGAVQGAQTMQFRFPDGRAMAFATARSGNQLQTNIGFGAAAQRFYDAIRSNPSLRIELPGVNDAVDVSLADREEVIGAMIHCRDDYLHGG